MKSRPRVILVQAALLFVAGFAQHDATAAIPIFAATCPNGIDLDTDSQRTLRVGGVKAKVREVGPNSYEARHGGVRFSIVRNGNDVSVVYTGPGRANGICEVRLPQPAAATAPAARPSHSERAGQGQFDARGPIPCAQHRGQPMGQCQMNVARDPGGSATVVVTRPDGRNRFIFFEKGKAIGADLSQADGNMTFRVTKQADLYMIQAGDERYEIPEAVVFGG